MTYKEKFPENEEFPFAGASKCETKVMKNKLEWIMEICKKNILADHCIVKGIFVEIAGEEKLTLVNFDSDVNTKEDFHKALYEIGQHYRKSGTKIVAATIMTEVTGLTPDSVTGKRQDAISLAYENLLSKDGLGHELWILPYTIKENNVEFGELTIDPSAQPIMVNFLTGYFNL